MKLKVHTNVESFEQLKPEWNVLLARSTANQVFSTWEWQYSWWKVFKPGELWIVECRDENGKLVGLAPWFIDDNQKHGRVVRSIGCVDVTDYLDIILDKDLIDPVLARYVDFLVHNRDMYNIVDLCNLPEESPTYNRLPQMLQNVGYQVELALQEVCPIIKLPSTWEEYLDSLDKKQRHEIRRKLRRAEGTLGDIEWYIVDDSHDLEGEINCFLHLMAASQTQKAGFLGDRQNTTFLREIIPRVYKNGWLQLSFLKMGGDHVAAYLNFDYANRILVYNSGLLPEPYGHLSPGIVLLAYNIRHAIESGRSVFDFLRGNEIYKYRMGGQDTRLFMLRAKLPST